MSPKEQLFKEINCEVKEPLDREVFKKSEEEKYKLKMLKFKFKQEQNQKSWLKKQ